MSFAWTSGECKSCGRLWYGWAVTPRLGTSNVGVPREALVKISVARSGRCANIGSEIGSVGLGCLRLM